jgi:hypothetical protein
MGILGDYFLMTLWKCKDCFYLLFGLLIRNLPSLFQGQNQRMINLMHLHLHQLHLRLVKNLKTTSDADALAQAVSSLAPSKEEQEQRMLLLAEETHHNAIKKIEIT